DSRHTEQCRLRRHFRARKPPLKRHLHWIVPPAKRMHPLVCAPFTMTGTGSRPSALSDDLLKSVLTTQRCTPFMPLAWPPSDDLNRRFNMHSARRSLIRCRAATWLLSLLCFTLCAGTTRAFP